MEPNNIYKDDPEQYVCILYQLCKNGLISEKAYIELTMPIHQKRNNLVISVNSEYHDI